MPVEDLAHRALDEVGKTLVPRSRSMLPRMAGQQPRRPQLMRIAQFLRLPAGQRHQPGLGLSGDRGLLAGPRPIVERRHRAIGNSPLHAALYGLMMHPQSTRYARSICARSTRLAGSVRDRAIALSRDKSSSPIVNSNTCRHAVMIFDLVQRITNEATTHHRHEESRTTDQFHGIERLAHPPEAAVDAHSLILGASGTPIGHAFRDDLGRLHRRLTQARVFDDLALYAFALVLQPFA